MRAVHVGFLLIAAAATASATPARAAVDGTPRVNLTPILLDEVPDACLETAQRAAAPNLSAALSARIALATCLADAAMAELYLTDSGESVLALEDATRPAFALLDEVNDAGDAAARALAAAAEGELYQAMRVRLLTALPSPGEPAPSIAQRDERKATLASLLAPWSERAELAFQRVLDEARDTPAIARNPAVRAAIGASRKQVAARVTPPAA